MAKTNVNLKLSTEEEEYRRLTESIARNLQQVESLKRDMEKFVNSLERLVKKIRGKTPCQTQPL